MQVADRLGVDEGAVKLGVHRLRRRFGKMLQEEVAHTVSSEDQIEGFGYTFKEESTKTEVMFRVACAF